MAKKKYKMRDNTTKINFEEVKRYILKNPNSKISFGCDSVKFRKGKDWWARYISVIVVYEQNKNKIFAEISHERDFDNEPGKPHLRMMNEVFRTSALVMELADILSNREYEVHIDVNALDKFGSNCALQQAVGYIKGVNGIDPIVKNNDSGTHPWAASCVADHLLKR